MRNRCFVVMGVSGCGKTTVSQALAEGSGGKYLDADDFHPQENRDKMSAGIPLEDEDRRVWLDKLNTVLKEHVASESGPIFLACSALKEKYRMQLRRGFDGLDQPQFLYLNGSVKLIQDRMKARSGHFMPPELLQSQFAILEEPEKAIWFDVVDPVEVISQKFFRQFSELKR